ncbi:MAG: acetyl-CoA hydrolase/transferase C-terminal domain-containing protein [Anaerococcus sp.]|nr:acetyl-CoA hydrolase/transferase C-terminal domain-containing protein [Anaerococcus sp.]
MDFKKLYQEKLITAEKAASMVKDGDWVEMGWGAAVPVDFDKALAKRVDELKDVKIRTGVVPYNPYVGQADSTGEHFIYHSYHATGPERNLINGNKNGAFFIPIKYSEIERYIAENLPKAHISVIQVSPMDKHGNFNFGISVSHAMTSFENSEIVILEVNENMPVALGGFRNYVNIKDVDYVFESSNYDMLALAEAKFTDEDVEVAKYVVDKLRDGDTLQLGIGGLPNAIGKAIAKSDLKDLGVHTEMYVDSFMEMAQAGKITGRKKNINPGRQTYAFAAGKQELYDYIDGNEELMAAPVSYVNDIDVIAAHDNYVSINTVLEVDLWGQISAESAGTRHISGAGGALDFVLGAYRSKGGRSFITLKSSRVNKEGKRVSNIVPTFKPGTQATAVRANTHYIATEQGIANFKGLSTWQAAEALIGLAHPETRDDLIKAAEDLGIWRKSNK